MQLDWAINTTLIQKRLSRKYQSNHYMWFYDFFVTQDYYDALVLPLIWYYSTSWVSNIGNNPYLKKSESKNQY